MVTCFTNEMKGSWNPSSEKRLVWESLSQSATFTSQRSGSSASISTISRPSLSHSMPSAPRISSTAKRATTPMVSPTASFASSISSRKSLTRFSSVPPYSSLRWL